MSDNPLKVQAYIFDGKYKIHENKPVIYLFGKSVDGEHVCFIDDTFQGFFYAIPKEGESPTEIIDDLKETNIVLDDREITIPFIEEVTKNYRGEEKKVLKIYYSLPMDQAELSNHIGQHPKIESVNESDINYVRRYLMDMQITPLTLYEISGEPSGKKLKVPGIKIASLEPISDKTIENPKIMGVDIETYHKGTGPIDPSANPILMIAFTCGDYKKVLTWKRFETDIKDIEFVASEAQLIQKIQEILSLVKPDIITGYFSDGFDFPYVAERAKKYKINLDWGLDYSSLKIDSRGKPQARASGLVHIDTYRVIRQIVSQTLKTESLSLDAVSEELLGEKKIDVDILALSDLWDEEKPDPKELEKYCLYNIKDSELVERLLEKVFPNVAELVKLIGQFPFDVSRMAFSQMVEWFLLRKSSDAGFIAPNKPTNEEIRERRYASFEGAYVYQPQPGIYEDIAVFDFRSLYPSIIVSHNISLETLNCQCCKDRPLPVSTNYGDIWFCRNKKGFMASIIEELITRRARVKELLKKTPDSGVLKARSEGLKLVANSIYGYLSFSAARWYSLSCAEAITALGRHYIKGVIDEAEKKHYKILYGDTDSIFLALNSKTVDDAKAFVADVNKSLPGIMELQYEGHFKRGIFVSSKSSDTGAKKKYAMIDNDNKLKIKGFATVRRNTSKVARVAQKDVLQLVLEENSPESGIKYIKNILEKLKSHETPCEDLIITTMLSKDPSQYGSKGPHVRVAEQMQAKGQTVGRGTLIPYVISKGPGSIGERARIPEDVTEYDDEYYTTHQIIPVVEQIFKVFNVDIEEEIKPQKQTGLDAFF